MWGALPREVPARLVEQRCRSFVIDSYGVAERVGLGRRINTERVMITKGTPMTTVRVFDPAMCCSTGICGPAIDPQLVRFATDLDWLKSQGVSVERFNLSQQPAAFAGDEAVKQALETKGEAGLPLVKVNGEVKSSGTYPTREQLAAWVGLGASIASSPAKQSGCCQKEPPCPR